ncbi:MAG: heme ABC exporter ATP-binding protein CcmA [Methylobacteriaceae bacterium]|nr:heme ABC exporter ATP-binding protein CcmA [Methylobacteriaceae bacterium]
MPSPLRLIVDNLAIDRGGRRVLEAVGFAVAGGEALVVTGANGAGKSTLLAGLAGLLPLAEGRIGLDGADDPEAPVAEYCHYVGHREALKSALTPRESLAFWRDMLGAGRPGLEPEAALAEFDLAHAVDFPCGYLSAGQRRRASLARILVAPRPIWLLDEPVTALDVASQARFADLMRAHLAGGGLIVAATHAPIGLEAARALHLGQAA